MAEFRRDSLTGRWVLVSPERLRRPPPPAPKVKLPSVPFLPLLVDATSVAGTRDRAEVHLHRYPPMPPRLGTANVLRFASGRDLVDVGGQHRAAFAALLVRRLQIAHAARRTASIVIFRNHGPRAGASLALPHHQLYAMPVQSPEEQSELAWVRTLRSCPTCSLQRASSARRFWVASRPGATLLARPAARFGAELLVVPRRHARSFAELRTAEQEDVVALVALGVRRLRKQFGDVGLNEEWLERVSRDRRLHFRVELLPRINAIAGLELGTGVYLNPYLPEHTARRLRALRSVKIKP